MSSLLVVDDQTGICGAVEALLGREFRVYSAKDGWEALSLLGRLELDVVLLDLLMPGMSGWEALPRIRKTGAAVLLTSVLMLPETGMDLARMGACGFIAKPWNIEVLKCLVRAAVAQRRWSKQGMFADSGIQQDCGGWAWYGKIR